MSARLRILVVAHTYPFPPRSGYLTRVAHIVRQLAKRHEVVLLSYADPSAEHSETSFRARLVHRAAASQPAKRAGQLASLASTLPFAVRAVYSRDMQNALDQLCSDPFDIIQLEGAVLGGFRFPSGTPVVLDEHNIDYEVFERMHLGERSALRRLFYRFEKRRFRTFERASWGTASACILTSDREEEIVRAYAPGTPTCVVPNAVDVDAFRPRSAEVDPGSIVFNGTLDYRPNLDAAYHLVDDILPLIRRRFPDARVTIVGRGTPDELRRLERPGVRLTGEVDDVRSYLQAAAVVAVPVRMGGGTRLKVVEGLAMAKGMVSTTLGCEGIDVRDGKHLLLGNTAAEFAFQVGRLFADPSLAARLGEAGRELIAERYSWEGAVLALDDLYRRILRAREKAAVAAGVGGNAFVAAPGKFTQS